MFTARLGRADAESDPRTRRPPPFGPQLGASEAVFARRRQNIVDDANADAALAKNDLRSLERGAPDRIVERRRRRVEADDAGFDDRARAVDAREKCGGDMRACCGDSASGGLKDRMALRVLHPDKAAIAGMAFLEIAHAGGKSVAGGDLHAIAGDEDRADLADPVRTIGGGAKSGLDRKSVV